MWACSQVQGYCGLEGKFRNVGIKEMSCSLTHPFGLCLQAPPEVYSFVYCDGLLALSRKNM